MVQAINSIKEIKYNVVLDYILLINLLLLLLLVYEFQYKIHTVFIL